MRPFVLIFLFLACSAAGAQTGPILTPKPGPAPRINGPTITGARPGKPFLHRIPATGERPMRFAAEKLPAPLQLDPATGIIRGMAPTRAGTYEVRLRATNRRGSATRRLRIVVGDTIALTPPMGWNHWYTHYHSISDRLFREAADAMIASGMADFGYQYVSIDDCWMRKPGSSDPALGGPPRDERGVIRPNDHFPDMKALTDYIHAKGLKAGIYTSPGPLTCAKYEGSYQHEEADARQFADWGFDLLKYDWCSYRSVAGGTTLADLQRPYRQMGAILKGLDRDILFNLCQYGMGDVSTWGREVGGHSWRTTGDLGLEKDTRLPGFYSIAFKNQRFAAYAQPGGWNDPDYILIGHIGNARNIDEPPRLTTLTPDEQYSYLSMWAFMASPLFYSGHMGRLDEFTLNVLCNAEVIEINQDALGKQATAVAKSGDAEVWVKDLEEGAKAVGLLNFGETETRIEVRWADLGFAGKARVRDVWRQRDLGVFAERFSASAPRHGVVLVRVSR